LAELQRVKRDWHEKPAVVVAPGPSLSTEVTRDISRLIGWKIMLVQDAYRMVPWGDALYGCDERWWDKHQHCEDFKGVKWSSHDTRTSSNDKLACAERHGLQLVQGRTEYGFSTDPNVIHYGENSGFQAINLTILLGSPYIVLVGFDMRIVGGKSHFFGDHPPELFQRAEYQSFTKNFKMAPAPEGVTIINATPDSALTCYPMMDFDNAIENYSLCGDWSESNAPASGRCALQGL
jgi:hypothetical protein